MVGEGDQRKKREFLGGGEKKNSSQERTKKNGEQRGLSFSFCARSLSLYVERARSQKENREREIQGVKQRSGVGYLSLLPCKKTKQTKKFFSSLMWLS